MHACGRADSEFGVGATAGASNVDPIPHRDTLDVWTNGGNDASAVIARRVGRRRFGINPRANIGFDGIHPHGMHPHHHLTRAGLWIGTSSSCMTSGSPNVWIRIAFMNSSFKAYAYTQGYRMVLRTPIVPCAQRHGQADPLWPARRQIALYAADMADITDVCTDTGLDKPEQFAYLWGSLQEAYYAVVTLHAGLGTGAELLGLYIVLRVVVITAQ